MGKNNYKIDLDELRIFVLKHPEYSNDKIAFVFGVGRTRMYQLLDQLGFVRRHTPRGLRYEIVEEFIRDNNKEIAQPKKEDSDKRGTNDPKEDEFMKGLKEDKEKLLQRELNDKRPWLTINADEVRSLNIRQSWQELNEKLSFEMKRIQEENDKIQACVNQKKMPPRRGNKKTQISLSLDESVIWALDLLRWQYAKRLLNLLPIERWNTEQLAVFSDRSVFLRIHLLNKVSRDLDLFDLKMVDEEDLEKGKDHGN